MNALFPRQHIQDHSSANTYYWGYAARVLPCTRDEGTCEYLEAIYGMHETSMLYSFIMWGVILGVLALWAMIRVWRAGRASHGAGALLFELADKISPWKRKLLPDTPFRWLFGRVSRLQVVTLGVILAYLLVFSQIGIVYRTWITPISGSTLHNTRTGMGGWADRIGVLAYALTPLAVLLCMRESVLSLITGIPYQHFNFLHRWLGRVIFVQSILHTIGWTIIEANLYQPQPKVYVTFIQQQYMIFGCIAMFFISYLTFFSTKWAIRKTGYEFFKITHWIVAILYIGACWGHWDKLYCWMVPSLALIVIDQSIRGLRILYLHMGGKRSLTGFQCAQAEMQVLTDDNGTVIRLDFDYEQREAWEAGQHFYLTFPSLSIWQAHPYTISSVPEPNSRIQHHTYLMRVRDGQTKKLAALGNGATLPVIMTGPYGHGFPSYSASHVLAIAGGTGVTFTYPIIMEAVKQCTYKSAVLDFVWVVRKAEDLLWLSTELKTLKTLLSEALGLRIMIYVSRDVKHAVHTEKQKGKTAVSNAEKSSDVQTSVSSISSRRSEVSLDDLLAASDAKFQVHWLKDHHPSVAEMVLDFRERSMDIGGAAEIVGSGPEAMGSDLRAAVANVDVGDGLSMYWDSRE